MKTTPAERKQRKLERASQLARINKAYADAQAHVARGVCPQCGARLKRNTALTGWWQCAQFGAVGFRADANKPACSFQCFTA